MHFRKVEEVSMTRAQLGDIMDQWVGQIGCSEYRVLLSQIEELLALMKNAKVNKSDVRYTRATKLIAAETGALTRSLVLTPTDCKTAVAYSKTTLSDLNALLKESKTSSGGPLVNTATPIIPEEPMGTGEYLNTLKWVAGGVGAIAVLYIAGPALRSILTKATSAKKPALSGYSSRRRRRRRS